MKIIKKILNKLLKAKRLILICHIDPDGDTIWSAMALAEMLKQKGVSSRIICADKLPLNVAIYPGAKQVGNKLPKLQKGDVVVAMEAGDKERLGFVVPVDINIDHHFDNTKYGRINWVDAKASALGSMVYMLSKIAKFKITPSIATLLYSAICSDTGGFRFGNTNEQTFADAYELVKKGAKPDQVYHLVYENVSPEALLKLGQALCNLKFIAGGKIVYSSARKVDAETGHGIIDVIRIVRGSEIAILFKEIGPKRVKVSLRSKNNYNVQAIAKKFGGGGHKKAAGCEIDLPLNKAISKLLAEVKRKIRK